MARPSALKRLTYWVSHQWRRSPALLRPAARDRVVFLHVGPHKTGTTTFQATIETNAPLLAPHLAVVPRRDTALRALCVETRAAVTAEEAARRAPAIAEAARQLARANRHRPRLLVSQEDLIGARPTKRREQGVYETAVSKLAPIVAAFEAEGARVVLVFTKRDFRDWIGSLQRDLGRRGRPAGYAKRHNFPKGWAPVIGALREAFGERLLILSFEEDRADGRMGIGILRAAGVPEDVLARIAWSEPRRVTDPSQIIAPVRA